MSLSNKRMGSLSNSSFNSDDFDDEKSYHNKRKNTSILPPQNNLTKTSRIIQPEPSNWNITSKVRKRKLLVSSGPTPRDSLNTPTVIQPKKRKSKNAVVIHDLKTNEANIPLESGLLTSVSDEVASFFDKVHESPKKAQLDMYVKEKRERDKLKVEDSIDNTITIHDSDTDSDENTTKTIKKFLNSNSSNDTKNQSSELSLDELIHNKAKLKELVNKCAETKSYIRPDIIKSLDDIGRIVETYLETVIDILNGVKASYFYTQAKKLQQSSKLLTIKDAEIASLPKETYYGYIGAVRGFHIGKVIESNETLSKLINEKIRYNKVIQFWGVSNFIQYVLVPEVIANLTMKYSKINDIEEAYDEMEETNEYGLYITNAYPLKMNNNDDEDDDDNENDDDTDNDIETVEIPDSYPVENTKISKSSKSSKLNSSKYWSTRKLISMSDLEVSPPSSPDNLFD